MTDLIIPGEGPCSGAFQVRGQITVFSSGLDEGDVVTFELVTFEGLQSGACPCPPLVVDDPAIASHTPIECCRGPVRLTAARPFAVLDLPDGSFFRACIEYADGPNAQHIWFAETHIADVTDYMRGCPDPCCDTPENWQDTGAVRCVACDEDDGWTDEEGTHHDCPPSPETGPTPLIVEYEQRNPCGDVRWQAKHPSIWYDTGTRRCRPADGVAESLWENYPCGQREWVNDQNGDGWHLTGNHVCDLDTDTRYDEERNDCGDLRIVDSGESLNWVETGQQRCSATHVERQEVNECGDLRWTQGEALEWVETGQQRCTATDVERQEVNQCGDLRWTVSEPLDWQDTGNRRCLNGYYDAQHQNQCGGIAWDHLEAEAWVETGQTGCNAAGKVTVQETNQCGQLRWTTTAEDCESSSGDSSHSASIAGSPASALEGSTFTFTVTLDSPVAGSNLVLSVALSGDEQTAHSYATPRTVTIPVGSTTGSFSVTTINDAAGGPNTTLTATIQAHPRLTGIGSPASVTVLPNAVSDSTHTILSLTVAPLTDNEGSQFCWTVTLDSNVAGSPLTINGVLSGSEQTAHGYTAPSVTIPVGSNSGVMCVTTIDDSAGGADTQLCLAINAGGRITTGHAAVCATVTQNAPAGGTLVDPPTFQDGSDGDCNVAVGAHNAACYQTIDFKTDGTWTIRNHRVGPGTTILSGNWITGTFTASDYEVRMTGTETLQIIPLGGGGCGSPTSTDYPRDSGWLTISATRSFSAHAFATKSGSCGEEMIDTLAFSIEIREKANHANTVTGTGSVCADATAG